MSYAPTTYTFEKLVAELRTDPTHLGYSAFFATDAGAVYKLLTDPRDGYPVPHEAVQSSDITKCYAKDLANFSAALSAQVQVLTSTGNGIVDVGTADVQSFFESAFAGYPATLACLRLLYNRNGSRCEWLFGTPATGGHGNVSQDDVSQAINFITANP